MSLPIDPDISRAAAALFTQRQRKARELVRAGRMDPATATRHLRPWLAIACRCGADLPDLAEGLSDTRTVHVWPPEGPPSRRAPGSRHGGPSAPAVAGCGLRPDISGAGALRPQADCIDSETEARAILADEICPRSHWAPVLAKARDEALLGQLTTEDQLANARALAAVARHLAFDPNGKHPVPLFDAARAYPAQQSHPEQSAAA